MLRAEVKNICQEAGGGTQVSRNRKGPGEVGEGAGG